MKGLNTQGRDPKASPVTTIALASVQVSELWRTEENISIIKVELQLRFNLFASPLIWKVTLFSSS